MILTGHEDLRIRKTIQAIHTTFSEMLLEMPYEKITVKALCERALINKTTFYRYYPVLDDLLAEIQSEYARPYAEHTAGMRYPADIEQLIREFLTYSAKQGPLYDAILSSGTYANIMQELMDEMGKERVKSTSTPKGWDKHEWSLYLDFVNMSQIRFYQKWVADGRRVPLERMVDLAVSFICDGARR